MQSEAAKKELRVSNSVRKQIGDSMPTFACFFLFDDARGTLMGEYIRGYGAINTLLARSGKSGLKVDQYTS